MKGPAPPRFPPTPAPDVSRSCATCRHVRLTTWQWLARLIGGDEFVDPECRHPVVVGRWHENTGFRWFTPDLVFGGPIFPADPVSGRPERRCIPARLARAPHHAWPPASIAKLYELTSESERAPSNCGPDGRYWEARHGR